jgi:hypothetical protein
MLQRSIVNLLSPSRNPKGWTYGVSRFSDFQPVLQVISCLVVEKYNAIAAFLFRLEHDALILPVDISDFHREQLSSSNSCLQHDEKHRLIPDVHTGIHQAGGIFHGDDLVSMLLAGGLILRKIAGTDLSDGIVFSDSFEYREVIRYKKSFKVHLRWTYNQPTFMVFMPVAINTSILSSYRRNRHLRCLLFG